MPETSLSLPYRAQQHNWIRLRTIIMLRWVAIVGQIVAITVAQWSFNLQLELGWCYLVIGVSITGNLIAIFIYPENKRLSETENLLMWAFDLTQLGVLLYLTGGLTNPFTLLLLGPVTASASTLSLRYTVVLVVLSLVLVTLLARFNLPLSTADGFVLRLPTVFLFGNWAALVIALLFLGAYSWKISNEMHMMSDAVQATYLALSREQKLTDIGGVVAAAAHELGTPLATIMLTSSELANDLAEWPDMAEDATLIREQAVRCRDILHSMGRAGKDDLHLRRAPLAAVLQEAAEPHCNRGKHVFFEQIAPQDDALIQPDILRRPEVIHGIRNLVQNAVDFADTRVWVEYMWSDSTIAVRIVDDGKGFPSHLLGRIGDPFMGRRKSEQDRRERPEYEGMGLGLFIAKTLLERSGAELSFANGSGDPVRSAPLKRGAIVEVVWPRKRIAAESANAGRGLGANVTNTAH